MTKIKFLVAGAAALAISLPAVTATATPPSDVTIVAETTLGDTGGSGPFTAEGDAVTDGLFCSSGFSFDVGGKAAGFQSERGINFQVFKAFVCDDESGAIIMKLQVRIDRKGNNYSWNVVEGFGAYEDLHGTGRGFGISPPEDPDQITDTFIGRMHND